MAQFDVYLNPNPRTRKSVPYLLDVQNNLLDVLSTRVVVPLKPVSKNVTPARHLNPSFEIKGKKFYMSTAELVGVPRSVIGNQVCSLAHKRFDIVNAIDFLVTGI